MPDTPSPVWSPARAVLSGGLVVGFLDILTVIIFYGLLRGTPATRIFQSVAGGWYGPAAFTMGWRSIIVGAATHFGIAMTVVVVYYLMSRRLPILVRHPVLCGMAYGVFGVFAFMNLVVLPLSAAGRPHYTVLSFAVQIFSHLFCIGLPAGVFVSRARRSDAVADTAPGVPLPVS